MLLNYPCTSSPTLPYIHSAETVVNAYSELFDRMDFDGDGFLSKSELDQYMMRTEGAPVQETAFQWLKHKFESKEGTCVVCVCV